MKKTSLPIVLLALANIAICQNLKETVAPQNKPMPVMISYTEANELPTTLDLKDVSMKAVRHLKRAYKNVDDEKWYEMPDGYRAKFAANGIQHRLDYDKNGTWIHTIRYYDEKKLPAEVRRLVVSNYLDYTIKTVEEIEMPHNAKFYVVHLEGQTNWLNIKVSDDEIYELENIRKS